MPGVAEEVTGPANAVGEVIKGIAAKNATMKDGPPENGGGQGETRTRPTPEQKQAAYDKYKEKTRETWNRHTGPNGEILDPTGLGLEIGQNIADLAMEAGGDVLKLFGELVGKGK